MSKTLSQLQRKTLFRYVHSAAAELGEDPEAYRKRVMKDVLDAEHLADVNPRGDYERLMSRICSDAGDFNRALSFSVAAVGRYRYAILATAREILAFSPNSSTRPIDYVAGLMFQSRMIKDRPTPLYIARLESDSGWLDFSTRDLKNLLAMLHSHLSRLKRRS